MSNKNVVVFEVGNNVLMCLADCSFASLCFFSYVVELKNVMCQNFRVAIGRQELEWKLR